MRLDLYFSSPMQSWGMKEFWYDLRRTEAAPTKSAVTGMIGRCMGILFDDEEALAKISDSFEIATTFMFEEESRPIGSYKIVEKKPITFANRMTDDQNVYIKDYIEKGIAKGFRAGKGGIKMVNGAVATQMLTKDYLMDEKLGVTIEGSEEFLKEVRNAFLRPHWQPYLGRKCCVPAGPIIRGEIY